MRRSVGEQHDMLTGRFRGMCDCVRVPFVMFMLAIPF